MLGSPRAAETGRPTEFADPHPGGVKQFHQAFIAGAIGLGPAQGARGGQQRLDLGQGQRFGQALVLARPRDPDGRILAAPPLVIGKPVKLANGRQAACAGGAGQPLRLARNQIGFDIVAAGGVKGQTAVGQEIGEIQQIAAIPQQRIARRPGLGGLCLEKGRNPASRAGVGNGSGAFCRWGGDRAHPRRSSTTSSSAARRAVLSRPTWRSSDSPAMTRR